MRLRQQAAQILADVIARNIQLGKPPTVIDAPPSDVGDYPAVAIWVEKTELAIANDMDLQVVSGTQGVAGVAPVVISGLNASDNSFNAPGLFSPPTSPIGEYAVGADPVLELFTQGDLALLAPGVAVSHAGTIRSQGRMWVGARHSPKREEVEEKIWLLFMADRTAKMRLLLPLAGAKLGRYTLAWGQAAATMESDEWSNEFAFSQRLWDWMPFLLDIPLLVPRFEPIVTQMLVDFSQLLAPTIASKADLQSKLPDLIEESVNPDGSVTP